MKVSHVHSTPALSPYKHTSAARFETGFMTPGPEHGPEFVYTS